TFERRTTEVSGSCRPVDTHTSAPTRSESEPPDTCVSSSSRTAPLRRGRSAPAPNVHSPAIAGLACTQWGQPPCGSRRRAARLGSRGAPPPGDGRPLRGRSHRPSGSIFCLDAFGTVAPDPFRATALVGRTRNNLSPAALLRDSFGASLPPRLRSTPRAL